MRRMSNIKPISDLRNYTEVLKEVTEGSPVFLTKNGKGEYVILDVEEYNRLKAALVLTGKLGEGEASAKRKGWISEEEGEYDVG